MRSPRISRCRKSWTGATAPGRDAPPGTQNAPRRSGGVGVLWCGVQRMVATRARAFSESLDSRPVTVRIRSARRTPPAPST
jgi:hypothetical protein